MHGDRAVNWALVCRCPNQLPLPIRATVIERESDAFLVQNIINLSQVDGQLTDLRVLASVRRDSVVVSRTPWGCGAPAQESNGKVNISDKGFEFAVCTAADPRTPLAG